MGGTITDFDGFYKFDKKASIPAGTYDIEISYPGLATKTITGVQFDGEKNTKIDFILENKCKILGKYITTYQKPFTDKYVPDKVIIDKDQIKHAPY